MASFQEIETNINATRAEIDKCLVRCRQAPYPTSERQSKLDRLRNEANTISKQVEDERRRIEGPAREQLEKLDLERANTQRELQEIEQKQAAAQRIFYAERDEFQARRKPASAVDQTVEQDQTARWQAKTEDFESKNAEYTTRIAKLRGKVSDLNEQHNKEQKKFNEESSRLRDAAASDVMIQAEQEMKSLLDRVGAFEKEIASGANAELVQKATVEFEAKSEDFSLAEKHHQSQALYLLLLMIGVIVLAAVAVYVLFIYLAAAPGNVERIVALATGRVAILVFLGFALKYLADLHRAHSEQAVIYCDRKAALSVAKVLLNATSELEQKRAILRTLSDIYLNFEDSAFVARRPKAREPDADIDAQIRRMKDTVEALKPVLDAFGKTTEKIKP